MIEKIATLALAFTCTNAVELSPRARQQLQDEFNALDYDNDGFLTPFGEQYFREQSSRMLDI